MSSAAKIPTRRNLSHNWNTISPPKKLYVSIPHHSFLFSPRPRRKMHKQLLHSLGCNYKNGFGGRELQWTPMEKSLLHKTPYLRFISYNDLSCIVSKGCNVWIRHHWYRHGLSIKYKSLHFCDNTLLSNCWATHFLRDTPTFNSGLTNLPLSPKYAVPASLALKLLFYDH